jgi:hypothetical protein
MPIVDVKAEVGMITDGCDCGGFDGSQCGCHRLLADQQSTCPGWLPPYLGATQSRLDSDGGRVSLMAPPEELLEEARRLDLSSAGGRFRLGELTEVLRFALPAVADLHERLALDLEVDRDTITEAWSVASAFPTRYPPPHSALDYLCDLAVPPGAARVTRGETWILDSPEGVCAGRARFEYPATFVLFSS